VSGQDRFGADRGGPASEPPVPRPDGPGGGADGRGRRRARLSVATIATDEADRLPRTLASVSWADEVVVVDGGSTDGTREVAREHGARVVESPWPGYARQKRRALEEAAGPWVLLLDADEEVTPALGEEIRGLLERAGRRERDPSADRPASAAGVADSGPAATGSGGAVAGGGLADGYEIRFLTRYLGHWFGRRGWDREWHLRLVRKDKARILERAVHEGPVVEGRVERLGAPIRHYTYRDVSDHLRKMQEFSRLKAEELHARGRRGSLPGAVGHAAARFLAGYVVKGRFLDGWPGLVHELLGAFSTLLAYVKLWERRRA